METPAEVIPRSCAISLTERKYQYLCMKMIRVSLGSERRKEFTASRRVIASAMSPPSEGIHSASSSSETHGLFSPRFLAFLSRRRPSEALRVSLPRYVARFSGFCGGILFHAPTYASETHSLASSSLERIPFAIAWQYLPYFFCVSSIAVSERAKTDLLSLCLPLYHLRGVCFGIPSPIYTEKAYEK